jgi:hypothetical protein
MEAEIESSLGGGLVESFNIYHALLLLGFVIAALFKLPTPLRYHVKFCTFVGLTMFSAVLLIPVFLVYRPTDPRNIK